MRASDHFYSELDALARRAAGDPLSAERGFSRLAAPVVGEVASGELFRWWRERHASGPSVGWDKLGHLAAFVLGEYDDASMDLDAEDWASVRDIVSAEAEEMNLADLTRLMADLVSRGALD